MVRPEELTNDEPLLWSAGRGTEVWDLFCACAAGDLETVERSCWAFGVVAGTAASLWVSRFVATLLYGLQPQIP